MNYILSPRQFVWQTKDILSGKQAHDKQAHDAYEHKHTLILSDKHTLISSRDQYGIVSLLLKTTLQYGPSLAKITTKMV